MPPSENLFYSVRESKDGHCIAQKDTQPSRNLLETCFGRFMNTLAICPWLRITSVSLERYGISFRFR